MITDDSLLEELYAPNRWFQICNDFLLITDMELAGYLSYLVGVSRAVRAAEKAEGWFFHTHIQIENKIYTPRWKWVRIVKTLKQLGYLESKRIGIPAKSYYKVNLRKIHGEIVAARIKREAEQLDVTNLQHLDVTESQHQDVTEPQQHSRYSNRTKLEDKTHYSECGSAASLGCDFSTTASTTNGTSKNVIGFGHNSSDSVSEEYLKVASRHNEALINLKRGEYAPTGTRRKSKKSTADRVAEAAKLFETHCKGHNIPSSEMLRIIELWERFFNRLRMPKPENAQTFLDKWDSIVTACEIALRRSKEVESVKHSAPVQLPPKIEKILTELSQLNWPMGSIEQLPSILLQSYNNYEDFHSKLFALHNSGKSKFATHLYHQLHNPEEYIHYWFVDYNEQVSNWSDWSGDLKPFTITHKRFKGQMCNIANEWSGDSSDWNELLKQIQGIKL